MERLSVPSCLRPQRSSYSFDLGQNARSNTGRARSIEQSKAIFEILGEYVAIVNPETRVLKPLGECCVHSGAQKHKIARQYHTVGDGTRDSSVDSGLIWLIKWVKEFNSCMYR